MELRRLIFFLDTSVTQWNIHARLLRWLTFLWLFVGLVVLFSASYPEGITKFGDGFYYLKRQLVWVLLGLIIFNIIVHTPLRYVLGITDWFMLLLLGLIVMTLIPGVGVRSGGAVRWLALGRLTIQPTELIKPFLVLQSARVFGKWKRLRWSVRLMWLLIFALMLLAIVKQPNLSTTALCGMTLWLVALAAGLPYIYLAVTTISGVLLALASIKDNPYQLKRVLSFFNPFLDPMNTGYQLNQSLIALGSGGIWGAGYGLSQQKGYIPDKHTDFIFAVFAEEFGLIGSLLLLLLLMVYATLALIVAFKARNTVHRLVAIGAMILMVGQSVFNIGVATGALPTTGVTLPLVSYGGNSMIANLLIAALLIRVARESSEAEVVSIKGQRTGA